MSTWYLGPLGDMRALVCPEPNIKTTEVRFGGIHQGLSGARTIDVTGIKAEYQFSWTYLEEAEWNWLRAMHTRLIPGPFRLIDPLRKNRLSVLASKVDASNVRWPGVSLQGGVWSREWDWPPGAAAPGAQSLRWFNRSGSTALRFDQAKRTAVFPGEQITGSVYIKAGGTAPMSMVFDWYDRDGQISASTPISLSLTNSWARYSTTATAPAGAMACVLALYSDDTTNVRVAAPQVESGLLTDWEHGGAERLVLMDQLDTSSPRFPLTDCSLTLLEA